MMTKKDYKKRLVKDIKFFQEKKKKKSNNTGVNDLKVSLKMKRKEWFSIEENTRK